MLKHNSEKGAVAILASAALILVLGIAAFAIDLGLGFSERRGDQTAADVAAMAGAVETLGSNATIRDYILDFAERNVPSGSITVEQWASCTDPERATLNSSGHNFVPVAAPSGWPTSIIDCVSVDPAGYVRVNLPPQTVKTTFGRVLGVDELSTGADAIARITNRGGGGILPFGILATAGDGQHVCLRDNSAGLAEPPCDGGDQGNFGGLESPHYGNSELGTTKNCTESPKKDVIAVNIAVGLDHRVVPDPDGLSGNEILDTCAQIDAGHTPDTLNTFQGISNGLAEGVATGPIPGGFKPRLQQGANPKRAVFGYSLDDRPLWYYLLSSPSGATPASCAKSSFDNSNPDFDWDGDGTDDHPGSWQHMVACLTDYVDGGYSAVLFDESLAQSPRFAYVPQFWESTWPSGNGWRHILRYKATWLQGTWWKKGGTTEVFYPGEPGTFNMGGNWQLRQLSGILLPDAALPEMLRGDPPTMGGVNPYTAELYR